MATIYYTASSIDGFIVDERDSLGWLLSRNIDADGPFGYRAFSDSVGALVMGATTYDMVRDIEIMVAAVVIAMFVMYAASGPVAGFIRRHPTTKMLALAFLLLIGIALIADGFEVHIPRGYIYFAMAFAGGVELSTCLRAATGAKGKNRKPTTEGPAND